MRWLKAAFCLLLCAFLLVGCGFDMNSIDRFVKDVTPKDVRGEIKELSVTPLDGREARKLDFENISFTNTENAKIKIVPSDETRVEATYSEKMDEHGFSVKILEGEVRISTPRSSNFIADIFEITVYANINEIEVSGGITIEMDAKESKGEIDIDIEGAASAYIYNISVREMNIDVAGAASITLSGNAERVETELNGAGTIDAKSLVCKNAEIGISGAGTAEVSVTDVLMADLDGVGTLKYYGDPAVKNLSGGLTDLEQVSKEIYGG